MPERDVGFASAKAEIDLLAARADVREVDEALIDALHDHAERLEALENLDQPLEITREVALTVRAGASEVTVTVDVVALIVNLALESDELLGERLNFGQRRARFLQRKMLGVEE